MDITKRIFGIDALLNFRAKHLKGNGVIKDIFLPIIIRNAGYRKLGASLVPGCVVEEDLTIYNTPVNGVDGAYVVAPFPSLGNKFPAKTIVVVKKSDILLRDNKKQYIYEGNTKLVESFDESKIPQIREYIRAKGALTLIIKDYNEGIQPFLLEKIKHITEAFKHSTIMHAVRNRDTAVEVAESIEIEDLVFHATFVDFDMCMPVFNSKYTDGIGIICEFLCPEYSKSSGHTVSLGDVMLLVANHSENVFVVDGQTINRHNPVTKDLFEGLDYVGKIFKTVQADKKAKAIKPKSKTSNVGKVEQTIKISTSANNICSDGTYYTHIYSSSTSGTAT